MFVTPVSSVSGMLTKDLSVRMLSLPALASMPVWPDTMKLERVLSIHAVDCVLSHFSFLRMSDIFRAVRNASSRLPSSVCVMSTTAIWRSLLL